MIHAGRNSRDTAKQRARSAIISRTFKSGCAFFHFFSHDSRLILGKFELQAIKSSWFIEDDENALSLPNVYAREQNIATLRERESFESGSIFSP